MKAKINFNNAKEFQELLQRAATLSEQLQETLQQINNFELDIDVKKTGTTIMAPCNSGKGLNMANPFKD